MRLVRVVPVAALLALFGACSTTKSSPSPSQGTPSTLTLNVSGSATVPGATGPFRVVAQTPRGAMVGAVTSDASGGFTMPMTIPSDVARVYLMAVYPADPEQRSYGIVEVASLTSSSSLAPRASESPPSGPFVVLDPQSTATSLVATAAIDDKTPLSQLAGAHATEIQTLRGELERRNVKLCSAESSSPNALDAIHTAGNLGPGGVPNDSAAAFLKKLQTIAESPDTPLERLTQMQRAISDGIQSISYMGWDELAAGLVPTALSRITIKAFTGEPINDITDSTIAPNVLAYVTGVTFASGWGNCREKAYIAAYGASEIREVQQVAILGLTLKDGGQHAFAIACTDPSVKLQDLTIVNGQLGPPALVKSGKCIVVDPWLGPASSPRSGQTAVLDANSATRFGWGDLIALKMVKLDRGPTAAAGSGKRANTDCARPKGAKSECAPFTLPGTTPDAGPGPSDAAKDTAPSVDACTANGEPCPTPEYLDKRCEIDERCTGNGQCELVCCFDPSSPSCPPFAVAHSEVKVGAGESLYCGCLPGYTARRDACTQQLVACE